MTSLKKKNDNVNLKKAISFLRLNLTMEELGEKLGYKKATISKYINGTLPPSSDFLNKFEEVFKIKLNDFETKETEIKNPQPSGEGGLIDKFTLVMNENANLKETVSFLQDNVKSLLEILKTKQ